MDKVTVEG